MTKVAVNEESLMDIANAIRTQNGTQTTYKPSEMGDAIEALQPTVDADAVTVTANNTTQHIYPDTDKYFDEVIVNPVTPIVHPTFVSFFKYPNGTIDISWLRTDNITNMTYMFGSTKLTTLDVSNFNTENVTDMSYMFHTLTNTDPNNLTGYNNFDTSNVKFFNYMFYRLGYSLTTQREMNLSNFDFSSATDCTYMFQQAKLNKIILNSPNNPNLLTTTGMFQQIGLRELDLSNFDVSKVSNANSMFGYNTSLTTDSLNSIMGAFVSNTGLSSSNKTLKHLGFTSAQANTMTGLSNWSLLQANGWSTGF